MPGPCCDLGARIFRPPGGGVRGPIGPIRPIRPIRPMATPDGQGTSHKPAPLFPACGPISPLPDLPPSVAPVASSRCRSGSGCRGCSRPRPRPSCAGGDFPWRRTGTHTLPAFQWFGQSRCRCEGCLSFRVGTGAIGDVGSQALTRSLDPESSDARTLAYCCHRSVGWDSSVRMVHGDSAFRMRPSTPDSAMRPSANGSSRSKVSLPFTSTKALGISLPLANGMRNECIYTEVTICDSMNRPT